MSVDRQNPLSRLIADDKPINLDALAETLEPYVEIQREPPHPEFTWAGLQLTNRKKILVYLLARKAMQELALIETENAAPTLIEEETRIKGNTIRPILKELKERRLVRNLDGYFVPNNALIVVKEILANSGD